LFYTLDEKGLHFIKDNIAKLIDHTLLKPGISMESLKSFLDEALKYNVRGVVVTPSNIPLILDMIHKNRNVKLISVVSFPIGEDPLKIKIIEICELCSYGVDELDIVLNTTYIKMGRLDLFENEVKEVVSYSRKEYPSLIIKLILEVPLLNDEELSRAISIINRYKPDYLKTSTGHVYRGTTVEDVRKIRKFLDKDIGIKAAGGIRNLPQALELIDAGADIIGSSRGIDIIKEALKEYE
jgi:deoxyribose-phosphate aldolase